jgi:hypothetical protein
MDGKFAPAGGCSHVLARQDRSTAAGHSRAADHRTNPAAGLQQIKITLESNVESDILVVLAPGVVFEPTSSSAQTMVARELREIILETYAEIRLELKVA